MKFTDEVSRGRRSTIHVWFAWHPIRYNSPADHRKGWAWLRKVERSWVEKRNEFNEDTSEWWYWVYKEEEIICAWCGWKNGAHLLTCKHWTSEQKRRMRASR